MKKILGLLILLCLVIVKPVSANFELAKNAKASLLLEPTTNTILYENNKDEQLRIASMTKIMTLSIVYDEIKAGKISLEDKLITSAYAKGMEGSRVFLDTGEESLVKDLIKCVAIASANDAAVTLAEGISGTEAAFVLKMNEKAQELKMNNTLFSDVTGLADDNHYSSAYDMALISSYLLNNHKEVLAYTSLKESYFRETSDDPFWLVNTNKLAGRYEGIDGLKTGWTSKAGYCMSLTGVKNNMRLISIVLGVNNSLTRNKEALELLNYGFSNFENYLLLEQGKILEEYKTIFYKEDSLKIEVMKDIRYIIKKGEKDKYTINFAKANHLSKKGILEIKYDGKTIYEEELAFSQGIKRNIFSLFMKIFNQIFI